MQLNSTMKIIYFKIYFFLFSLSIEKLHGLIHERLCYYNKCGTRHHYLNYSARGDLTNNYHDYRSCRQIAAKSQIHRAIALILIMRRIYDRF